MMGFKNGDIVRFQHSFFPIDINVELMIFSNLSNDMLIRLIGVSSEEIEAISELMRKSEISGYVFYAEGDVIINERSKIGIKGYTAKVTPTNSYMWIFDVGGNITQNKLDTMFYNPYDKLCNSKFILKEV